MGRNLYKNNRGFGLIEILVATALLGIISVGVMDVVNTAVKTGRSTDQNMQATELESNVNITLSDPNVCKNVFGTQAIPLPGTKEDRPFLAIYDGSGAEIRRLLDTATAVNGLQVNAISLETSPVIAGTEETVPYNKGKVNLTISVELKKTGATTGPENLRTRTMSVLATIQTAGAPSPGTVEGCVGNGSTPVMTPTEVCTLMGGDYSTSQTPNCQFRALPVRNTGTTPTYPVAGQGIFTESGIMSAGAITGTTVTGSTLASTGVITSAGSITATTGNIIATAGDITGSNLISNGAITANGNISTPTGSISGLTVQATGPGGITTTAIAASGMITANGGMTANGSVNITGTTTVTGNMNVTGAGVGIITANQVSTPSDFRLKKNIQIIPHALEKILQIRGVTFDWKNSDYSSRKQMGVIAQEVEKVAPELIYPLDNGMKSVAYPNMVGLLIEAIKEQQKQINDLKSQVETLKQQQGKSGP